MSTTTNLQAAVQQLSAIEPRPDELQTVINQGTVLLAMAKDIEAGHVPKHVSLAEYKASINAYCDAVSEYLHNPQQKRQV